MDKKYIIIGSVSIVLLVAYLIFFERVNGFVKGIFVKKKDDEIEKEQSELLQIGSTGDSVVELQKILNKKGAKLLVDGKFGAKTEAALQKYFGQKSITLIDAQNRGIASVSQIKTGAFVDGSNLPSQIAPITQNFTPIENGGFAGNLNEVFNNFGQNNEQNAYKDENFSFQYDGGFWASSQADFV